MGDGLGQVSLVAVVRGEKSIGTVSVQESDVVAYWRETADDDYRTMQHLFSSGDYHWCLFMGHLVIEKLLKACYAKRISFQVPRTHDLLRIADLTGLAPEPDMRRALDELTTFNINARYPDIKRQFYRTATKEFAAAHIHSIERIRGWLLTTLSD